MAELSRASATRSGPSPRSAATATPPSDRLRLSESAGALTGVSITLIGASLGARYFGPDESWVPFLTLAILAAVAAIACAIVQNRKRR